VRQVFAIVASVLLAAATASPARAAWGCGSQLYPGGHFRTFGYPTKSEAGSVMLRLCGQQHRDCKIQACRPNVDSEEQADAVWPLTTANQVRCGGGSDKAC